MAIGGIQERLSLLIGGDCQAGVDRTLTRSINCDSGMSGASRWIS
jgi:hypothetical protein